MPAKREVIIWPEVTAFLDDLPLLLVREGYKSTIDSARLMANEILDFLQGLPQEQHYRIQPRFAHHYARFGSPTHYAFFRRKSSHSTTWYAFFSMDESRILVKHISTNWLEGQYIR